MKAEINLTHGKIIRLLNEPFLMPDNLEIEIKSDVYRLNPIIVNVRNGNKTGQFKITEDKKFNLKEFLFAGKVEMQIEMYIGGECAKSWSIEPFLIKETEIQFEAIPEITEIKAEINKMKTALAEITKLIKENEEI